MVKIIASDMDGTFLRDDKSYNHELFDQVMISMADQGVSFAVASSNQYAQLKSFFKDSQWLDDLYFISENGGLVYKAGQLLAEAHFEEDVAFELGTYIWQKLNHKHFVISNIGKAFIAGGLNQGFIDHAKLYFHSLDQVPVQTFLQSAKAAVKFSVMVEPKDQKTIMNQLMKKFKGKVQIISSDIDQIDIIPLEVSKAQGLDHIATSLGVSREETVSFGNEENDIPMLEYTGQSFIMAESNPILFNQGFTPIGSNNDQSVLKKIKELLAN